jgi:hypothetical protein
MFLFGTLISANAQVPNYVPSNGLVGWYSFSGNANDGSGNGNNGTVNGATLTNDRFNFTNSAYSFDGINDFISLSSTGYPNGNQSRTISIWFKISKLPLVNKTFILLNYGTANNNGSCGLSIDSVTNGGTRLNFFSWSNSDVLDTVQIGLDQWHSLIGTSDGSISKLYYDGKMIASKSTSWNTVLSTFTIGKNNETNSTLPYRVAGNLDDFGVWNRALTQQEITNLYNGNICIQTISVTDTLIINVKRTSYIPLAYTNTIKVFPNPTNDKITIDNGDLSKMTGYSIKIYNSSGQQLFQSNITQQQFSLDITQWGGNGIYFVELKDNNGNIVDVKKIVLQ